MTRPKLWFYPYDKASMSVHGIVDAIPQSRIIRRTNSNYRKQPGDIVINWGCHKLPVAVDINKEGAVYVATSKTKTFDVLAEVENIKVPKYTRNKDTARRWLQEGHVLGRDLDSGSKGKGITFYRKGTEEIRDHRFYVKYVKKEREFRIHVFNNRVIFRQEKLRVRDNDNVDKYIRSHNRGWCFAFRHLGDNPVPPPCDDMAIKAIQKLGLDFGGVDVGWNDNGPTIFEINTAPGIEETTLKAYVDTFKGLIP